MRRRDMLGALALAAAPGLAFADTTRSVPLKDALHFLDLYLTLPAGERTRFYLAYRAVRDGRPAPRAEATIVAANGVRTPVGLDREGWVSRLPTLAQLKGDRLEMSGAPFQFALEMRPTMAPAVRLDPEALSLALAQLNSGIAKSGSLAFLAPKMTAAFFVDAGGGQALLDSGRTLALPVVKAPALGAVPYFEPASAATARAVLLTKTPSRILLGSRPTWA
jgi:hypothetical protein